MKLDLHLRLCTGERLIAGKRDHGMELRFIPIMKEVRETDGL